MAWALRIHTRRATHISMLSRAETGLACECVCPACDGVLQAVNAGKTADEYLRPGSKRPFFRHHTGQQGEGCLRRIAQWAALELLATRQELVLPAPTFRRHVVGVSGDIYTGDATGSVYRARVLERHWIDEQAATLTLDDGRVIMVCLSGLQQVARDGRVDAVITIDIDDPLVSTWGPDEILARVQLEDRWLCWDSHWDEGELGALALEEAKQRARDALDLAPEDLALPDGLSDLQRSESVLHAVLKQILAETQRLHVPGFDGFVERTTRAGQTIRRNYGCPPFELELANVRLETRLGSIVPDVICDARDTRGQKPAAELMVEVAVTHRVSPAKASRIEAMGIACLELDASLLASGRTIRLPALRQAVQADASNKRWIFHPQAAELRAAAAALVDGAIAAENERAERLEARRAWFMTGPLEEVVGAYLVQARHTTSVGIDVAEIAQALEARGFRGATDAALRNVLARLASMRDEPRRAIVLARLAIDAAMRDASSRKWVTLLADAVDVFVPGAGGVDANAIRSIGSQAHAEVAAGKLECARPRAFDALIATAFPELAGLLADPRGSVDEAQAFRVMAAEQLREAAQVKAQQEAALEAEEKERRRAAARERQLSELNAKFRWRKVGEGGIRKPEDSIRLVKNLYPFENPTQINGLIDAAWAARSAGVQLAEFILDRVATSPLSLDPAMIVLKSAWIIAGPA
jgi:hypothetical protein